MTERESFEQLSNEERALVGEPDDYAWDEPVAAPRARRKAGRRSTQFSLRIDQQVVDALAEIAERRHARFSDIAREALESYVGRLSQVTQGSEITRPVGEVRIVLHDPPESWPLTKGPQAETVARRVVTSAARAR